MPSKTPVIETSRLVLRGHELKDFPSSAAMWADPQIVKYISGKPSTHQMSWSRYLTYHGLWHALGYGYWVIEEKSSGDFVGEAGLADFKRELSPSVPFMPEAGWALRSQHHGKGYASEAMDAILKWADVHIEKTFCMISPENGRSIKLAEKMNYKFLQVSRYQESEVKIFVRAR